MPAAVARAIESKPLARRVLADDAYETLRGLIFDRHIAPDSWMAIDAGAGPWRLADADPRGSGAP